jgi:phospholipase/lecithinase/hemolysin
MKSIFLFSSLALGLDIFKKTELYVIGDSLSDDGNVWVLTDGKRPDARVYPEHKYTNCLVWNEYLGEKYRKLNVKNYAAGGSTVDGDILRFDTDVPSLKEQAIQISGELDVPVSRSRDWLKINKRIAVIWGGSNDFVANATVAAKTIIPNLLNIANILKQTKKFDDIFIFNLVNIAKTPLGNSLPAPQKAMMSQLMIQINQALEKAVQDAQAKDPSQKLTLVDADSIAAELISIPQSSEKWEPLGSCVDSSHLNTTQICEHPEYFFYYDLKHPNTISHKGFSEKFEEMLDQYNYI